LANTPQARKRARQNTRRRADNHSKRSMMRTYIKRVYKAIEDNDRDAAQSAYREAVSFIDRNAKLGLQHRNKAARLKSRINARIRAMS
jgi:small subunit ribosomal protein S20